MRGHHRGTGGAFSAAAVLVSLLLSVSALIFGVWAEERLLGAGTVNIRQSVFFTAVFTLLAMETAGAYRVGRRRLFEVAFSVLVSVVAIHLGMMALPFFDVSYVQSPYTAAAVAGAQLLLLCVWAVVFHRLYFYVFPRRAAVVVADSAESAAHCAGKVSKHSREFEVILATDWNGYFEALPAHEAVIAYNLEPGARVELREFCLRSSLDFCVIPELWELGVHKSFSFQFGDLPVLRFRRLGLSWEQRAVKRAADILLSLCALAVLSLPVSLLALAVFLQDRRNPIFAQERLTRDSRVFRLYKLRTMVPGAEEHTGPTLAAYNDPRVTRLGRFLRLTRLDETPQFINVLKGDMSVVGPRPERLYFHTLYSLKVPEFSHRLSVKAGITGMAHVYGRYDTRPEERIRLDLYYILHASPLLDIKIMIETARIMLSRSYAEGLKGARPEFPQQQEPPETADREPEPASGAEMERV
ncbi:MAG: sugar transferase [Oscillospiraceae bacterium]|nr:sugar transferase [Oscillospiraceae bacterium]